MSVNAGTGPARPSGVVRRTRAAILDGAERCLERDGVRRTTMSDVAVEAGVAKATLYNHFHTKDDVLAALVEVRVAALAQECLRLVAVDGPAAALAAAARGLSGSRVLRRVAGDEPGLLARLAEPGPGRAWDDARASVEQVLAEAGTAAGPDEVALVLRHLLSHLLWPAPEGEAQRAAALLVRSLTGSPAGEPAQSPRSEGDSGLGWPA